MMIVVVVVVGGGERPGIHGRLLRFILPACCRLQGNELAANTIINGFGSRDNPIDPGSIGGGKNGLKIAWQNSRGAMGSSGIHANLDSSQNSVGGPIRPHLHPSVAHSRGHRMGRRISDGGPYVQSYRHYIEKKYLPEIKSNSNIKKSDSNMSSTSSVKMLLMEQLEKKAYGMLPNRKEWLQQVCAN